MSNVEQESSPNGVATSGNTAATTKSREQFIPLRRSELVELLAGAPELSADEQAALRRFCSLVESAIHQQFLGPLGELKDAYAPFDPDADTRAGKELSQAELGKCRDALFQRFEWLLERGNFLPLKQHEIDRALADRTWWGMSLAVNFEVFERLELYYRGDTLGTRYRRRLSNRFRSEAVDVPVYQRLIVMFRLRPDRKLSKYLDTHDVHIKLFKDIPQVDIEMLLPGTSVQMSAFDRLRIMLPTLSGVSMAIWKIVMVTTAPLYTSLAFLGLVGGTVGYGVRSLFGYFNTRQKYQLNLTQSLYYQNLDNNAGVIHRLLDEAQEQENREALLAYFFLWRRAPPQGFSTAELDGEIEAFLRASGVGDVDFEIADALAKLERLSLVESYSPDRWSAVPIERAIEVLEKH